MNFSRSSRKFSLSVSHSRSNEEAARNDFVPVKYGSLQDDLPRARANLSLSRIFHRESAREIALGRSRHSARLSPLSAFVRGARTEITRHDCPGIDRDLIIVPASFPSTIFSITQSSRPTAAATTRLSMAL